MPWPAPSPIELALLPRSEISEFDVAWAKGMTMHHQAAVDMAWAYNRDPLGRSRVLRLMNLDIIREQRYEIGLLDQLIVRYWSVIGPADGIDFRRCLEENAQLAYGGFALKEGQLVMMDTQLVQDADPMEVGASIGNLAAYADRYERDLFGVDKY